MNLYKVGDIVCATWGYSMVIVNFYEVTRTTPAKVGLRRLKQERVSGDGWAGTCKPVPGEYDDDDRPYNDPNRLYKVQNGEVQITDHPGDKHPIWGRPWDGSPKHYDHCD